MVGLPRTGQVISAEKGHIEIYMYVHVYMNVMFSRTMNFISMFLSIPVSIFLSVINLQVYFSLLRLVKMLNVIVGERHLFIRQVISAGKYIN